MATVTIKEVARTGDHVGAIVTYCQQIDCDFEDFEAAAVSDTVAGTAVANCTPLPLVQRFMSELFEAPSASAAVVELGDSGDPNGLSDQVNSWGDGDGDGDADTDWVSVAPGADASGQAFHATYTPLVKLTLTDDNCADLTAGKVSYRFFYQVPWPAV